MFKSTFKSTFLFAFSLAFFANNSQAQVALAYNFTPSSGVYTPITGGTRLGATIANIDDQSFANQNIGFAFDFNGTSFSQFCLSANGTIFMGTTNVNSLFATPLSTANGNNAIAAAGGDLQCNTTCRIDYETIGNVPNRVCVIQWTNFYRFGQPAHNLNFQIRLHETSNDIEIVYGTMVSNQAVNFPLQVGIRGANISDFNSRTTTTNWGTTSRALQISQTCLINNNISPVNGLTYTWSPCTGVNCFAYPVIAGKAYIDYNNNSVLDSADTPLVNRVVAANNYITSTNSLGNYHFLTDTSSTTNVSMAVNSPNWTVAPAVLNITSNGQNNQTFPNSDFRFVPNGVINDLAVTITTGRARPGFNTTISLTYTNIGTTVLSGDLTLNTNSGSNQYEQFVSSNVAYATHSGNVTTWNFTGLQPFERRQIDVLVHIDSAAVVNEFISNNFAGTVNGTETALTDNAAGDRVRIRASFDPNDKAADVAIITLTELADGKAIVYTINFQNTGSDSATFVKIKDVLSNDLDLATLQTLATSHPDYHLLITTDKTQQPAVTTATWQFDNINLDYAAHNEPKSHGFVKFSIRPKQNLPLGRQIDNTARIIFDYNTPIITNTANVVIDLRVVNTNSANSNLNWTVSPNPSNGILNINIADNAEKTAKIAIYNTLGQLLQTENITANAQINFTNLPNGVYNIVLTTEKGQDSRLIVKQ